MTCSFSHQKKPVTSSNMTAYSTCSKPAHMWRNCVRKLIEGSKRIQCRVASDGHEGDTRIAKRPVAITAPTGGEWRVKGLSEQTDHIIQSCCLRNYTVLQAGSERSGRALVTRNIRFRMRAGFRSLLDATVRATTAGLHIPKMGDSQSDP